MTTDADPILDDLTPEQRAAVTHRDGPLMVVAGPGSGKTRVIARRVAWLVERGEVPGRAVLAITFTNKAADEMRARIERLIGRAAGVTVSTFHSFCARLLRRYGPAGRSKDFTIYDDDDQRACVRKILDELRLDDKMWRAGSVLARISDAKNRRESAERFDALAIGFQDRTVAKIYRRYEELLREFDALDFDDLLLYALEMLETREEVREELRDRYRYILVDEYQDTNRPQYEIANQLAGKDGNLCVVGDPDQCLPPDAAILTPEGPRRIDAIREGDHVIAATGWGKTSAMPVEKVMTRPYQGEMLKIRLASGRTLTATPNHVCFGRLDPLPGLHYVYLMWRRDKGYRIGTTSGVRVSKDGMRLNGVQVRTNQEVADAIWIVRACRDVGEARYHEQLYSVRYGIPTMVFHTRGRRMAVGQDWVDRLFQEIDTEAGADRLMADLRLDRRFPHHRPFAVTRGEISRKYVWFTVFGDPRPHTIRPWHEHRVQLVTSDVALRRRAEGRFPVRSGARGTWRIETSRKDYDAGLALAESIRSLDGLEVVSRARVTPGKAFSFMPASHLRIGMAVPIVGQGGVVEDVVESIESVPYDGLVYDLSVPAVRNFVAEGVVVHNSIYKWRGADIRNILEFERDHPSTRVVKLERNYRSTKRILAAAQAVIEHNVERREKTLFTENAEGEPVRLVRCLTDDEEARVVAREVEWRIREGEVTPGEVAVFYRTNALSRKFEEELRNRGIRHIVVGAVPFFARKEVKDALAFLRTLANPRDEPSVRRAIAAYGEGFGAKTLERTAEFAKARGLTLLDALRAAEEIPELGPRQRQAVRAFAALLESLAAMPARPVGPLVAAVLDRTGELKRLRISENPQDRSRAENLDALVSGATEFDERFPDRDFRAFLDQAALLASTAEEGAPEESVKLMTLHSAKGLEFDEVYIAAVDAKILPLERDMEISDREEERRLFYVGLTRARRRVTLTTARVRRTYGQEKPSAPSPFLKEIPEEHLEAAGGGSVEEREAFRPVSLGGGGGAGGAWRRRAAGRAGDDDFAAADTRFGDDDLDADFTPSRLERRAPSAPRPAAPPGPHAAAGPLFAAEQRTPPAEIAQGDKVEHATFGCGRVLEVQGSGVGRRVKVRFERAGDKLLVAHYANLRKVVALAAFVLAGLLLLALAPAARAHIVAQGLGMQSFLKVHPDKVYLEYNLGYSDFAGLAEVLKMESDRDGVLEKPEIDAWLDAMQPKILEGMEVTLDGKRLAFRLVERRTFALFVGTNVGDIPGFPFDTWWTFESVDAVLPPGEHEIKLRDRNFEREMSQSILWFSRNQQNVSLYAFEPDPKEARIFEVGTEWQVFARAATLFVAFSAEAYAPVAPTATMTAAAAPLVSQSPGMAATAEKSARDAGVAIRYEGEEEIAEGRALAALKDKTWFVAIALALFYGAAHALAPGHGKSMVAAFLIGRKGTVADAVTLGAIVTAAHAGGIFVLGFVAFFAAERVFAMNPYSVAGKATIWMEIVAGLIVFVAGVLMLFLRIRELEGLRRGHGHDHTHEHDAGKGLLALGIAAGLQPCTAGIMLVFLSIATGWLWKGFYLILAFSAGLGAVIIGIAVAMVGAKSLIERRVDVQGPVIRALPALSAATLTAIGAWVVIDVLVKNRLGPFAAG